MRAFSQSRTACISYNFIHIDLGGGWREGKKTTAKRVFSIIRILHLIEQVLK